MIALYHQTKTPISFWCKRGLNPRSLIQPSETLPVELTRTHGSLTLNRAESEYLLFDIIELRYSDELGIACFFH